MTIEEIKAIPIAAFLARMGYEPARRRGGRILVSGPVPGGTHRLVPGECTKGNLA